MRIYHAHAMCTYGKPIERAERKQIRNSFRNCRIVDPGSYEGNPEKSEKGLSYCFELIRTCDALVFARLLKQVTAGVGQEIAFALSKDIPVYELSGKKVKSIKKPLRCLTRESSVDLFHIWRIDQWRKGKRLDALRMTTREIGQEIKKLKTELPTLRGFSIYA
jgi:hypothetical protein